MAPALAAWRGFDGGFGFAFAGAAAPPGGRGSGSAIARKTCDLRRVGCIATRFGACAPFGEACVLRALARRVASHENLPETVREYVRKHAPEYADAPKDAAEIRELQR